MKTDFYIVYFFSDKRQMSLDFENKIDFLLGKVVLSGQNFKYQVINYQIVYGKARSYQVQ